MLVSKIFAIEVESYILRFLLEIYRLQWKKSLLINNAYYYKSKFLFINPQNFSEHTLEKMYFDKKHLLKQA